MDYSQRQISPLAQQAAGGNSAQSEAYQNILDASKKRQDYLSKQQEAYNAELENYSSLIKQSQQPEASDKGRWGAIATALGSVTPEVGNIGRAYALAGGAAGKYDQERQDEALQRQRELTLVRQSEVRNLEAKDQNSVLLKAMTPATAKGTWQSKTLDDGSVLRWHTGTNEEKLISATHAKEWSKAKADGLKYAIDNKREDADEFSDKYADTTVGNIPKQPSGIAPLQGMPNNAQSTAFSQQPVQNATAANNFGRQASTGASSELAPGANTRGAGTVGADMGAMGELTPGEREAVTRLIARINANPATAANDTKTVESIFATAGARRDRAGYTSGSNLNLQDTPVTGVNTITPGVNTTTESANTGVNLQRQPTVKFTYLDDAYEAARKTSASEAARLPYRLGEARGKADIELNNAGAVQLAKDAAVLKNVRQIESDKAEGKGEGTRIADAPEKKTVLEKYIDEANQTENIINNLLKHPGLDKATGLRGTIPIIGRRLTMSGTDSAEYLAELNTLNSRITTLALQNARVGSTSGATGFGALDPAEREMLRDSIKSTANEQDPETIRENLKAILGVIEKSRKLAKEGYERTYGKSPVAPGASGMSAGKLNRYQDYLKKQRGG